VGKNKKVTDYCAKVGEEAANNLKTRWLINLSDHPLK